MCLALSNYCLRQCNTKPGAEMLLSSGQQNTLAIKIYFDYLKFFGAWFSLLLNTGRGV